MTLVAELDSDETVAGHGPGAETEFVDYPATGFEVLQAWSDAEAWAEGVEEVEDPSWRSVWGTAAVVVGCGAVLAFVIGVVGLVVINHRHQDAPAEGPMDAASTAVADPPEAPIPDVPPAMPPDAQHLPTGPALFNVLVARAGITVAPGNDGLVLAAQVGHDICVSLAQGVSGAQIEADTVEHNRFADGATPTPAQAHAFVAAAEQVYCPQYGG